VFDKLSLTDYSSLGYNMYLVHHGSVHFFQDYGDNIIEKIGERTTTYDILRIVQTFSEIPKKYLNLFMKMEMLLINRFEQLTIEEITCVICGFAISGFGTPYFFQLCEKSVLKNFSKISPEGFKELCKGFIYPIRGSKALFEVMLPRVRQLLPQFCCNELCYILNAYHKKEVLPKDFAKDLEIGVVKFLRNTKEIKLEEIATIANVYCKTRAGSRELHKLLEFTIIEKLGEFRKKPNILHYIGEKFEESGLCSIDVLKLMKKEFFMNDIEKTIE